MDRCAPSQSMRMEVIISWAITMLSYCEVLVKAALQYATMIPPIYVVGTVLLMLMPVISESPVSQPVALEIVRLSALKPELAV